MDMMKAACDVQAGLKRLEDAAVEFDLACEAVHEAATDASEWCRELFRPVFMGKATKSHG